MASYYINKENIMTDEDIFHCDPEVIKDHIMTIRNYDFTIFENANALLQAVTEEIFHFEELTSIIGTENKEEIIKECQYLRGKMAKYFGYQGVEIGDKGYLILVD